MPQIPPNLYKLPGGKGYWFNPYPSSDPNNGSGVAHKISDPKEVERIFGTNIPEREWGAGTAGWTPNHGGGSPGGDMSLTAVWQMQPSVIHGDGLPPTPEQYAQGVSTNRPMQQSESVTPNNTTSNLTPSSTKATESDINAYYKKYFNRDAFPAEIKDWKNNTTQALDSFLQGEYKKASGISYDGSPITPGNQKTDNQLGINQSQTPAAGTGATGTTQGGMDFQNFSDLPPDVLNSNEWKNLTNDQKSLAYFTYKTQTATNEAAKADAQAALDEAMKLADPFFKEQIRIAQDSLATGVGRTQEDVQKNIERSQQRIKDIQSDLAFNRDQLSMEEQQQLASQLRSNQTELLNLQQGAAEAGLAFSSPRQIAENNMQLQQQDVAQSTKRQFNIQNRNLQVGAQRSILQEQQGQTDIQQTGDRQLQDIQRAAEKSLGTANTPAVPGTTPLGGVNGTLDQQRQQDVLSLQGILQQRQNPFNFNQ